MRLCGCVAVDNEENDDYNVALMVFYHWLLAESAIYPYSGASPVCPTKLSLRYSLHWGQTKPILIIRGGHLATRDHQLIGQSV